MTGSNLFSEINDQLRYFDSAEGQFIIGAIGYLTAAKEVRYSNTYQDRPTVLMRPTLHLVAHGVELLLKFPLVRSRVPLEDVRQRFGHDLAALWAADEVQRLRSAVIENAQEVWKEAAAGGKFPEDDFDKEPVAELERSLARLSELHGRKTDFALRYVANPTDRAPRPGFLIDAFGIVAERLAKAPAMLD